MTKNLSVIFKNRDFTSRLDRTDLKFQVDSYDFGAIGGCREASISITGGELGLWDTYNWLRLPVEIYDPNSKAIWWGYVHQISVRQDALEVTASLDSMVNRVAVAYSYVAPGTTTAGQRKTTAWADDLDSQVEYGIKESLGSGGEMSDEGALGRRASILAAQAWPYGGAPMVNSGNSRGRVRHSGARHSMSATLKCKGWWNTLSWKRGQVGLTNATAISHITGTAAAQNFGTSTARLLMQQITTGTQAVSAISVKIYANKVASPTCDVKVHICKVDSSGYPKGFPSSLAPIATATFPNADFSVSPAWLERNFATAASLEANKTYALMVMIDAGSTDNTNYFQVQVDTGLGYTGGFLRYSDNSFAWHTRSPDADLMFAMTQNNSVDTGMQIIDLVTKCGQFLTATDLAEETGLSQSSYQNGEAAAQGLIEQLMAQGGTNGRRLLSSVDINRRVQIFEEPDPADGVNYVMDSQATMYQKGGIRVADNAPPVGAWCRLKDVIPAVVDLTKVLDPSLQFIEGSTWSALSGPSYSFRGQPSIDSLLKVGA